MDAASVFKCDYTNLAEVWALAKRMGPGMTIIKHENRPNYNITHTSRTDLYMIDGVTVIGHTE
jgi:hypothetical protein